MAVILIATEDSATAATLSGTIESLGHTPLTLVTTENIVEDIVLNDAAMLLVSEELEPYSGWDVCEIVRNDPGVPPRLPVLMLLRGKGNVRRLERCGFTGTLDPSMSSAELSEEFSRQLDELAAVGSEPVTGPDDKFETQRKDRAGKSGSGRRRDRDR